MNRDYKVEEEAGCPGPSVPQPSDIKYNIEKGVPYLPQTREQFEGWAKLIFVLGGLEDTHNHRQVLAQTIQRLSPDIDSMGVDHFITALRKSDANLTAFYVIMESKEAEKAYALEQEARIKALEVTDGVAPV